MESVNTPSSKICSNKWNTSGCAFSISSNNTTLYGWRRTFSVNCPPSEYPTYPGGEPIILETLCFSIYSDISSRIIASSVPKTASESALDSSVFPTPVGPKKMKEPRGLAGSLSPAFPRRIARETARTASLCPTTRFPNFSSRFINCLCSFWLSFTNGIPVQAAITPAICSASINCRELACFIFQSSSSIWYFSCMAVSFWRTASALS